MLSKINKLISVLILVAIALYVIVYNREQMTVYFGGESSVSGMAGVILLVVFVLGFLCATSVAVFFGLKGYFREKSLQHKDRQWQSFYEDVLRARSWSAAGEWRRARDLWEKVLRRDPKSVFARVELARCLEKCGETREGLKVLEGARAVDPHNLEVLFRTAELDLALPNKTAAIDTLALTLFHHKSPKAAERARDLSEDLERLEDALEYHSQLVSLTGESEQTREVQARLELKQLTRDYAADPAAFKDKLLVFVKRHPTSSMGLAKLAELERELGKTEEAAHHFLQAAKVNGHTSHWRDATLLWLSSGNPERALSVARTAAHGSSGITRIQAELYLIRVLIGLQKLDDAEKALTGVPDLCMREGVEPPQELKMQLLTLKSLCALKLGKTSQAQTFLGELCELEVPTAGVLREVPRAPDEAPAPRLSTP